MGVFRSSQRRISCMKIASILHISDVKLKAKALIRLVMNNVGSKFRKNDSILTMGMLVPDEKSMSQKVTHLEDQLFNLQNQVQMLTAVLGKVLRQVNSKRQIKLSLTGLVSSSTLDYILSGLKNNTEVYELNLGGCGLED